MNREQARTFVAQTFTQAFDKTRFRTFAINLLNHIDESKAQTWNGQYVKDAFKEHIRRYERLGTYTSPDGDKLDVLVAYLAKDSTLQRARTAIRNFVADHLKTRDEKDAALVAFVSPTGLLWSFSYVRMEYEAVKAKSGKIGIETRVTPARRFSYVVGEGESCHTAQIRFLELLQDTESRPTLAKIEDAFSVEAVTKEFFAQYASLFADIDNALQKLAAKDGAIGEEFKSKNVSTVDFSKKLLGQIVFLYFLQKKGWLGVEKGKEWGTGPQNFLRRLVRGEYGGFENFFNDVLEPLFYQTLATDRGHEAWCKKLKSRIPFLDGGLFEPVNDYNWRKTDIVLPNKLFTNTERNDSDDVGTGVLDVFDRYNFTVNEAEPLEKEVAIDPEMLGKVFENLIEENRRKGLGSYYTPREIVHYMCQESLVSYLDTAINSLSDHAGAEIRNATIKGAPSTERPRSELVSRADLETFVHLGDQISHYEAVDTRYAIKMPKSIEQHARLIDEKLASITVCDPAVGSGAFPVGMMTEIVRARSALTPYFNDVQDRTPYHFKRHAIQNCLYGVDIDLGAVEIAKLRLWLSLVVDEEDVKQVKPLPNLFYKIVVGNSLLGVTKNLLNEPLFRRLEELKTQYFNEPDKDTKDRYKDQIEDTIHELTNGRQAFDFEIYFSEVFSRKGGFDVMIANPPYSSKKSIENKQYRPFFDWVEYKCDPFAFFVQLAWKSVHRLGFVAFILPVTWMTNVYYEKLRRNLVNTKSLCGAYLIEGLAFEHANVDTSLLFILREGVESESFTWADTDPTLSVIHRSQRNYETVRRESRYDIVPHVTTAWNDVRDKIEHGTRKLGSFCKISLGMKLARNDRFVSEKQDKAHPIPIVFGADISLYDKIEPTRFFDFNKAEIVGGTKKPEIHHTKNKILVQAIRNLSLKRRIVGTIDTEGLCFIGTVDSIIPQEKGWDIFYLLGVINSTLLNAYFRHRFTTISLTAAFLGELPIKPDSSDPKISDEIAKLVRRRLESRRDGADELEKKINQLVYTLYGLTPAEIEIVEA